MSDPAITGDVATPGPKSVAISILDTEGFVVTLPFSTGHTCTEAEAKVLNQTRRENLANNFRPKVKVYQDQVAEGKTPDPDLPALIASFATLDGEYIFTMASASTARKFTPEEKEARSIARDYIKQELDKVGRKIGDVPEGVEEQAWKDQIEAEVDRISETPEVKKLAKDIIKARSKTSGLQLGSLGIAGAPEEPAPADGSTEQEPPAA